MVLNSSKNKFCYNEEEKITESNNINNNEDIKSSNSSTIFNKTQPLSSVETGESSIWNSKEFINSNNNNKIKNVINNNIINYESNDELQTQIKYSLKKMSEQYYQYDNKCSLFNYYCSPFINNSNYKKGYFFDNKDNVDIFANNNNKDIYLTCPFESYKEKWFKKWIGNDYLFLYLFISLFIYLYIINQYFEYKI